MDFKKGRVLRAAGGFYDVITKSGVSHRCYLRGRYKGRARYIMAGDLVEFSAHDRDGCVIEKVLPRKNYFRRPLVANVSRMVMVLSSRRPSPDWNLLSRQLVAAESREIGSLICMNKVDLVDEKERQEIDRKLSLFPYEHIHTDALQKKGIETLARYLKGNISVFTGPSGVGKTSLINAVQPGINLKTAEVSMKGLRGRHTTRHVEIFFLDDGSMVVDTPGFTKADLSVGADKPMDSYFPEMEGYRERCQFRDCLHRDEPGCAVKAAVKDGAISELRYNHYLVFLKETDQ
ncbi:MAG: ribosome small subunit-dependent GTPase A [Firmicutes bacterium]|jgi:ribosome biogenesis GTPase|nr:ribosome small subunit-dependent GTPase A [Bacillota bacterium]